MAKKTKGSHKILSLLLTISFGMANCTRAESLVTATPNDLAATPGEIRTPSATITSEADDAAVRLSTRCLKEGLSADISAKGTIVVSKYLLAPELALLNLETGQLVSVGPAELARAVSLDHRELAYVDQLSRGLTIVDYLGRKLEIVADGGNWQGVIVWLDHDSLLIEKFINAPYEQGSSVRFNLSTASQHEFLPNFPNMSPFLVPVIWDNYTYSRSIFDPALTRVLYPAIQGDDDFPLILWDLKNERELARFHGSEPTEGAIPQWTADGSHFLVSLYPKYKSWRNAIYQNVDDDLPYNGGFEIFSITRDGHKNRLTYLTTKYVAAEQGLSLSPDEKSAAFWLDLNYDGAHTDGQSQLTILDISSGQMTSLCVKGGDYAWHPIWSPNGRYLIVTVSSAKSDASDNTVYSQIMLIDLETGTVSPLADGLVAEGWMSSDP